MGAHHPLLNLQRGLATTLFSKADERLSPQTLARKEDQGLNKGNLVGVGCIQVLKVRLRLVLLHSNLPCPPGRRFIQPWNVSRCLSKDYKHKITDLTRLGTDFYKSRLLFE